MFGMKRNNKSDKFGAPKGYLLGTLMGVSCLLALTPAAHADTIFNSDSGFCCFSVTLHQNVGDLDDIFVTVALTGGATSFANTGNGTNHPGFAFNLAGSAITAANITASNNLGAFHVGPDVTSGPDQGTFGYFFDIPGSGSGAPGPLTFTIHRTGILPSDFIANAAGFLFAADVCAAVQAGAACTGEGGVTGTSSTVPEPVSLSLVGGGLLALGLLRKRLPRP